MEWQNWGMSYSSMYWQYCCYSHHLQPATTKL